MTRRSEAGFTLVELLVAVVILSGLTASLAMAMIVSFRTTGEAADRLAHSHDMQISTSAFASDVQSADGVLAAAPPAPNCGLGAAALSFVWTDGAVRNVVTYALETASSEDRLIRRHCRITGAGSATDERVMSHFIASAGAPQCLTPPTTIPVACSTTVQAPREVSWTLTDPKGDSHTLRGTRRVA